jgi:hypothetical protein
MLREHKALRITDIQRGLGLSSPSVAQYHIQKLVQLGLVKEEQAGYIVERVILDNIMRFRRVSIPVQTAYVAFFGVTLFILLFFLRPVTFTSVYFFAAAVNISALAISIYETFKTLKRI